MSRFAFPAICSYLVALVLAGCSAAAPRVKVPLGPPATPLPPFFTELGAPCARDTSTSWGRFYHREISTRCGADGRTSIVMLGDYVTITGDHFDPHYDIDNELDLRDTFKGPILYPKAVLSIITYERCGRESVTETTVYADGWLLWIKGIDAACAQFPTAGLHIIDRRYVTARDERWFRDAFGLPADVALDDDEALRRALGRLPSVPPGKAGRVPRPR